MQEAVSSKWLYICPRPDNEMYTGGLTRNVTLAFFFMAGYRVPEVMPVTNVC